MVGLTELRRRWGARIKHWLTKSSYVTGQIGGVTLQGVEGTFRERPDQDDAWLFWLVGRFDRFYDIGANLGLSALFAKVQGPEKRILLADPNAEALALAARNLIVNGLSAHCEFICSFVGDRPGEEVEFYTVGAGAAGSIYAGHAKTAAALGSRSKVPTTTIDRLTADRWAPEFIKVDVEGAEHMVLEGATATAQRHHPWMMVEMHSPPELPMRENAERVLGWCRKVNYEAWYMKTGEQLTSPDLIAHRGKCHLLLLPAGTAYPEPLARIPQGAPLPQVR